MLNANRQMGYHPKIPIKSYRGYIWVTCQPGEHGKGDQKGEHYRQLDHLEVRAELNL